MTLYPTAELLLKAPQIDVERAVLRVFMECTDDKFRRATTGQVIADELFAVGCYEYNVAHRTAVNKAISRAAKKLEDAGLIEEPDPDNGKNGYRIISAEGRKAVTETDYMAAKVRSGITRE